MDTKDVIEWNNYFIHKKSIGSGMYSNVFYGYHKETLVEVAIKKILFNKLHDHVKDKVISEINILQKLNHHNIIKLYEYKFDGKYIILITEYCKDKDLSIWMNQPHTKEEITSIITQIICGITYLHNNNILHRDIKPENILLHDNIIKICDFGFSITIKDNLQMCNTICGTPLFMSPEILSLHPYTIKSEIWSLGILFYMILYHIHPFGTLQNIEDYRLKIKNNIDYPSINDMNHIISLIKKMLTYNPSDRPDIIKISTILVNEDEIFSFDEDEYTCKEDTCKEDRCKEDTCKEDRCSRDEIDTCNQIINSNILINNDYFSIPKKSNSININSKSNLIQNHSKSNSKSLPNHYSSKGILSNSFESVVNFLFKSFSK